MTYAVRVTSDSLFPDIHFTETKTLYKGSPADSPYTLQPKSLPPREKSPEVSAGTVPLMRRLSDASHSFSCANAEETRYAAQ